MREFIERFQRLKALYKIIKEKETEKKKAKLMVYKQT